MKSEEIAVVENPESTSPAASSDSPLLERADLDAGDYLVPGLIGVAGLALLFSVTRKRRARSAPKKPDADDTGVQFSKSFAVYTVGKDWEELVLEPFLAERAEQVDLLTEAYLQETVGNLPKSKTNSLLTESRVGIISVFKATHKVSTSDGDVLIAALPNKSGVQDFNLWLDEEIKKFQESY